MSRPSEGAAALEGETSGPPYGTVNGVLPTMGPRRSSSTSTLSLGRAPSAPASVNRDVGSAQNEEAPTTSRRPATTMEPTREVEQQPIGADVFQPTGSAVVSSGTGANVRHDNTQTAQPKIAPAAPAELLTAAPRDGGPGTTSMPMPQPLQQTRTSARERLPPPLQQAVQQLSQQRSSVIQALQTRAQRALHGSRQGETESAQGDEVLFTPAPSPTASPMMANLHGDDPGTAAWSVTRFSEVLHRRLVAPVLEHVGVTERVQEPSSCPTWHSPSGRTAPEPLMTTETRQAMASWTARPTSLTTPMAPVPPRDDSSNRSMDQEVIMEEVKRQVQLAMQGRDSELSSLKMENNELSKALDASAQLLNDVVQMGGDGQGRSSQEPEQEFSRRELEGNPAGGAADRKEPTGAPPGLQRVLRLPGGNPRGEGRGEPSFTEFPRGPTGRGDSAGGKPGLRMEDTTRPEHLGPSSGDPLQRATEFGGDELSLLDVLVQGMKQLQQVYMDKKNPESETVKGSTELPQLPDLSGDTGVEFSDWMYVAEQIIGSIGSLSDSSTAWFSSTLSCAKEAYERHQQATPMERLTISPVLPPELASSKWSRLERRVMTMMLTAMPQAVKEDAVTHRVATVASIVYRLHVLYAPGGAAERAALLKQLEGVSAGENVSDVIAALRKWRRNLTRTMEMGVTPPDSSVLLRGIELILGTALKKLPDVSFRLALARNELRLQSSPHKTRCSSTLIMRLLSCSNQPHTGRSRRFNMEQMIHPDYVQLKLRLEPEARL